MPSRPSNLPRVLITMGDPTGVGPEVAAGGWTDSRLFQACKPAVVGDPAVFERAIQLRRGGQVVKPFESWDERLCAVATRDVMPCLAVRGRVDGGQAAFDAIKLAAELTMTGESDAMVTGPISKAALQAAGHDYPGHTELLADLCGAEEFAMMLYLPQRVVTRCQYGLAVVHVTLHTSLRSVFDQLTPDAIVSKCRLADQALKRFGCQNPRVGVAALNPHAGEQGLFGDEEATNPSTSV